MMTVKNYIDKSAIHGIGIYAGQDIKKGEVIWVRDQNLDKIFTKAEVAAMPLIAQEYINIYSYISPFEPDKFILSFDHDRFMNHSSTPNTDFNNEMLGIATRDIAKGEEITCNYSEFCIAQHGLR